LTKKTLGFPAVVVSGITYNVSNVIGYYYYYYYYYCYCYYYYW